MSRPSTFFAALLLWSASGYGQQTDLRKEQQMEELVESLSASEDGSESSLLLEDISFYTGHQIYINKATEEELLRLNMLNFSQVQKILTYRESYGQILTMKEFTVMGGFSKELLQKMEPFVCFDQKVDSIQKKWDRVVHQSLLTRIKTSYPIPEGYGSKNNKPPAYPGSPYSFFTRYRAEVGKWLELGLTAENDAGEDFFRGANRSGFDFLSGFLSLDGKGLIRRVVLGDYHLRFGQGVTLWSGGGVSYASDLSSLMRTGEGIRPYSSSDENLFFRGAAVQLNLKPVKLSLFFSNKRRDANLETDSLEKRYITSFRMDGLHRTGSEKEDEKDVNERMFGGYGDFRFEHWRFGVQATFQRFGLPVSKGDQPYKSMSFEGEVNSNFGVDYHLIMNQISAFGEAGISKNLKPAFVNGLVWKAHPQWSLSFLYRYYDPAFQSFNSGAFAEGSGGKNEEGFYAAFEYLPASKIKLSGQTDLFYFPWMTYQTISPAHGHSMAFQAEVVIQSKMTAYIHARFVQKPQKTSGATGLPEQWDETTAKWRAHFDWKVNEKFQMRSRMELVQYGYRAVKEKGYLFFQDLIFSPSAKLKCWFRMAFYDTDGYNSRVYSYENDLLFYFAIPEFHGVGLRSYLNLKWQPCRLMTFYFKGGYTLRDGASSMGSGNDATPGNHRFDIRGQLYLKF
ncbi:MAG: helix-hairpin-helix domain-containing protein [Prolixibacteraceae bacterium]|nr:helix-hairpin-helix domain-containing protein [Prolixibacteraceae bacterium]